MSIRRCAIYCRTSSDENLGQAFNSIDAQRMSGEACILSHKGEGWICLPQHYSDGGFSGGDTDRPGLQRLLADVEAGLVNAIVIYKLDRLCRRITDFARLMEVFERHSVALVAVTQSIDTSTSMGRLIVNVLMSFAQFERELASDRARDKIALSRQRGQWTGGRPVLGYDIAPGSRLFINAAEAVVVRDVFARYLDSRSLDKVLRSLHADGVTTKRWTTKEGRAMGGTVFTKSLLWGLLTNPLYIGKVPHKAKVYDGLHEAIVDAAAFDRVQLILARNGRAGASATRNTYGGLLKGLVHCHACGCAMVHSVTGKRGKGRTKYRYYVCQGGQSRGVKRCPSASVPAEQVEQFVIEKMRASLDDPALTTMVLDVLRSRTTERIRDLEAQRALLENSTGDPVGVAEIDKQIAEARASMADRETVKRGLRAFEPIWASLTPDEQSNLLGLVVAAVRYDGAKGRIAIEFHEDAPNANQTAPAVVEAA